MGHFTPFSWVALSIFAGILAGIGQVIAKTAGQAGMPPYVLIGIVGFVWASCSASFLFFGEAGARQAGLSLPIMSVEQVRNLALVAFVAVLAAGLIFWVENLARFDALNKAPAVVLVLVAIELSAALAAILFDYGVMWYRDKLVWPSRYECGGFIFGIGAIILFTLAPKHNL